MSFDDLTIYTDKVPIIDEKGKQFDEIKLPEKIRPMQRRRCGISDNEVYYKGAGIIYTGHYANDYDEHLKLVEETGALYEKYNVIYPALFRRYGIFSFRHQPCFSDYEGACGCKEKNLIRMHQRFELSAIEEILDVIETPIDQHCVYAYRLKKLSGNYHNTLELVEYLLSNDFNTGWDKNLWDDIECYGYVRDLADWFVSSAFCHKLGTMYALLSDLYKKDKYLYEVIVRTLTNLEQLGDYHIIYIAALIVKKYSPNCIPNNIDLKEPCEKLYTDLWKELYSGKACCHLENEEEWGYIRHKLFAGIPEKVSLASQDLFYYNITRMRVKKLN